MDVKITDYPYIMQMDSKSEPMNLLLHSSGTVEILPERSVSMFPQKVLQMKKLPLNHERELKKYPAK